MTLQELQKHVLQLHTRERWQLVQTVLTSFRLLTERLMSWGLEVPEPTYQPIKLIGKISGC